MLLELLLPFMQDPSCFLFKLSVIKITVDDWVVASCHLHYGPYWGRGHQMRTSVTLLTVIFQHRICAPSFLLHL